MINNQLGIKTSRLSKSNNVEFLHQERNCYSTEDESCETLNPARIYHVDPPFWGLTTLSARVLLYIEQMRNINLSLITEFSDNIRYLESSIRNDLREGIEMIKAQLSNTAVSLVKQSETNLIIGVVVFAFVIFISMLFNAIPWKNDITKTSKESTKLLEMLPSEEDAGEGDEVNEPMTLLSSMRTRFPPIDKGRENIFELLRQLVEALKNKEIQQAITAIHTQLLQATYKQFIGRRDGY
ncbi:MAG: hypothetical protein EZS28_037342 [Streblomastix strix]|uniref:Uncharacterized protein n=1 Tax=Streblomastix strix TaxID=222440 RepID=A0A5J4UAC5_9EUKA|nr:MAG: hypothetical protein EZS28_037342 [Streblomastix strix]